jgi:hypothetical protein
MEFSARRRTISWLNPYFELVIRKGKIYQGGNGGKLTVIEENFNEMERLY